MTGFNLLNIGSQALQANQNALTAVGQNVTNASTEGYSRQTTNFVSIDQRGGVYVQSTTRQTDAFLTEQLWSDIASFQRTQIEIGYLNKTNDLIASDSTSISAALDNYFKAMQNVVDDPTSLPSRELFVRETEALADRFNDLHSNLMIQNEQVNNTIETSVGNLNAYTQTVADLNQQIIEAEGKGLDTNDLRDKRDIAVQDISEILDVRMVEQGSSYNIYLGNGQPLVTGSSANVLIAQEGDPDPDQTQIFLSVANGNPIHVTQQVSGGQLGGALNFRQDSLNPAINELGMIAIAVSETMNTQHMKGMDLNSDIGGLLFTDVNSDEAMRARISPASDNGSNVNVARVEIEDVSKLTGDDYTIKVNDTDSIILERADGTRVALSQSATSAGVGENSYFIDQQAGEIRVRVDGVDVTIDTSTTLSVGDEFLVQPTRNGAENIESVITDPKLLAFATPVKVTTDLNNKGTGVATVEITDSQDTVFANASSTGKLDPPLEIVFDNQDPPRYTVYDVTNPNDPQVYVYNTTPLEDQVFTSGQAIELDGYNVTINNQPAAGDRFSFNYNQDGVSDNRNVMLLSDLQTSKTMANGSFQDVYSRLVEVVGARSATLTINHAANKAVMESTQEAKASISGVNLDEEAALLVQYQQAYQASAQLITTSQQMFDTLLNSF